MTIAEHVYKISQELPPNMLLELLDFAEFLEQKKNKHSTEQINIVRKIRERFANLNFDDVVLPQRNVVRNQINFN